MPVGLAPAAASTVESKSVAISTSAPNLSTFRFPPKAARVAGVVQAIMVKQGKASGAADPGKDERARTE